MMSHMCGASNRGDARAIAEANREKGEIARRLTAQIADRDRSLAEAREEIEALRSRLRALEPLAGECERLRGLLARDALAAELDAHKEALSLARQDNAKLRREAGVTALRLEHLRARLDAQARPGGAEMRERPVDSPGESVEITDGVDAPCPAGAADLCGRCLLYVGGRRQTVCHLRDLVARRNGSLLHHDGGLEQSQARLGELVRQADEVFFPVDCVSHSAMDAVKRLCESHGKRMTVLRTASATTFLRALQAPEPGVS